MSFDPLTILRKKLPISFHDIDGNVVEHSDETKFIKIGDYIFCKDAQTSLKSKRGSGPFYHLDTIAFFFSRPEIKDMTYTEYLQLARKTGFGTVSLVDKKDLLSYVLDEIDGISAIDQNHLRSPAFSSFTEAVSYESLPKDKQTTDQSINEPAFIKTRPLISRTDVFQSTKDFTNILNMYNEVMKKAEIALQAQNPVSLIDSIRNANVHTKTDSKGTVKIPIIIVPAAPTALITMYNVKEFLSDSSFIPSALQKKKLSSHKESSISITRAEQDGTKRAYQIIDNPSRLSLEDWNRVGAVFVQGPAWQFKGWKWENPVDLFQNVCGFYLHYDDTNPDTNASSWNVHRLVISRTKRHLDATANLSFWETLDKFLKTKRL